MEMKTENGLEFIAFYEIRLEVFFSVTETSTVSQNSIPKMN